MGESLCRRRSLFSKSRHRLSSSFEPLVFLFPLVCQNSLGFIRFTDTASALQLFQSLVIDIIIRKLIKRSPADELEGRDDSFPHSKVKRKSRRHGRDQEEDAGNEAGEGQCDGSRIALRTAGSRCQCPRRKGRRGGSFPAKEDPDHRE